jgi:hypothetical protein
MDVRLSAVRFSVNSVSSRGTRPYRRAGWAIIVGLALFGCGEETPPVDVVELSPVPDDDATFVVEPLKAWCLIGNELTPGDDALAINVQVDGMAELVDVWVGDAPAVRLDPVDGGFSGTIDIKDVGPGEIPVVLSADGGAPFAELTFIRSHPLYVLVGTDWDQSDNSDESLRLQEALHDHSPELKLTHFVGPYTFTDPMMPPERVDLLVEWLVNMRDDHGDEIGVHIHPYCNFVNTTDVTCRHEPSVVYSAGDRSGYTVESAAYTEEEYTDLLLATDALFLAHGLGKPTSFRAGAWTADMSTLRALVNAGYTADSDAFNWARMEEWIGLGNGAFYEWVREHWSSIDDTSQPYYPSEDDILVPGEPALPILEVPLNGVMADYVTGEEMIEIFAANWPGGPLLTPISYAIGYHPPNFDVTYQERMLVALAHVDSYLYSDDAGPVVYATLNEMTQVWTPPP